MPAKSLLFWLAGEVSWLAVEVLSMVKIKVRISETKYCSFYKTLPGPLVGCAYGRFMYKSDLAGGGF